MCVINHYATIFFICFVCSRLGSSLNLRECNLPLGMESGKIRDKQLSASSSHDEESTGPQNSRIRTEKGSGAWCPRQQIDPDTKEWLQIDFQNTTVISAVETQGRFDGGRGLEYPTAYIIEYWRDSIHTWARYKDYKKNEIIYANTDTQSAVLRILDGGIVAQKLRIIPVSENTRTVCMRIELYGCLFQDSLAWYSVPEGNAADGLSMLDTSFDGKMNASGILTNGLGKLYDGVIGGDNFEKHPYKWVGWRRDVLGNVLTIEFTFNGQQNISSVSLHTSNFLKHRAQAFERAHLSFSPLDNGVYSPRTIHFNYPRDNVFESARWIRIPIPDRLAKKLRIELYIADKADWLLLSEVKFESGNVPFNNAGYDDDMELDDPPAENTFTYFSVTDSMNEAVVWYSIVFFVAAIFLSVALIVLIYITCFYRQNITSKTSLFDSPAKDVHLMIVDSETIKRVSPGAFRMATDNVQNSLLEKLPFCCESGSEYADPDSTRFEKESDYKEGTEKNSTTSSRITNQSTHYAASDIIMLLPNSSDSSSSKFNPKVHTNLVDCDEYDMEPIPNSNLVEIDPVSLKFKMKLGCGEFGEVHLCQLEHRLVAVKVLRYDVDLQAEADFKKEMCVLSKLKHQNIIEVVGVCLRNRPYRCIFEHMRNGDLCTYLRNQETFSAELLLSICTQIAAGMSYLETQNFVHRDLAARNCLVDEDCTIKIADFGMARDLYDRDYCKIKGSFALPIRWMAWEGLLLGKFTTKSDVWAFGITMWEVLNGCREQPYSKLNDDQVISNIQHIYQNGRLKVYLEKPKYCRNDFMENIMKPCWHRDERLRPTFHSLHIRLQNITCSQLSENNQLKIDFV